MKTEATYVQVKAKCLGCGLHFIVCTWQPERHGRHTLWCPECGQHRGAFVVWHEAVDGFIFEAVPGAARLVDIGPAEQRKETRVEYIEVYEMVDGRFQWRFRVYEDARVEASISTLGFLGTLAEISYLDPLTKERCRSGPGLLRALEASFNNMVLLTVRGESPAAAEPPASDSGRTNLDGGDDRSLDAPG